MKPLLLLAFLFILLQDVCGQSLDYIAVRKKNGRTIKNFYTGTNILFQTNEGSYYQGPVHLVRNDTMYIVLYDIRYLPTTLGTFMKDTVTTQVVGVHYKNIKKIQLDDKRSFLERTIGPAMMIGGAAFIVLNVVNGAVLGESVTDSENMKKLGIAAGVFAAGFILTKVFSSDGFTKSKHEIVYVDL